MSEVNFKPCRYRESGKRQHGHFWIGGVFDPIMIASTTMGWYYLRIVLKLEVLNNNNIDRAMLGSKMPTVATGNALADRIYIDVQIAFMAEKERACLEQKILENNARILAVASYDTCLRLAS